MCDKNRVEQKGRSHMSRIQQIFLYCFLCSQILAVNQYAVESFACPDFLLFCQLGFTGTTGCIVLTLRQSFGLRSFKGLRTTGVLQSYAFLVFPFFFLLRTNLVLLQATSLKYVLALKAVTCVPIAAADHIILGKPFPRLLAIVSLLGISSGTVVYYLWTANDVPSQTVVLLWSFKSLLLSVAEGTMTKQTIVMFPLDDWSRTALLSFMATPLACLHAHTSMDGGLSSLASSSNVHAHKLLVLVCFCMMGHLMSYVTMMLRQTYSPASVAVLGTAHVSLGILSGTFFASKSFSIYDFAFLTMASICALFFVTHDDILKSPPPRPLCNSSRLALMVLCSIVVLETFSGFKEPCHKIRFEDHKPSTPQAVLRTIDFRPASFQPVDNPLIGSVTMQGMYGRLGNRIVAISQMIGYAESTPCNISLPQGVLDGWNSEHLHFMSSENEFNQNPDGCLAQSGEQWYRMKGISPNRHVDVLRLYFSINSTHALGKKCGHGRYIALHVRSGDITSGAWNQSTGAYRPAKENIHASYAPFPTSYYVSVLRNARERQGKNVKFFIFCETLDNPTCEFFLKYSSSDHKVQVRIQQPLIEDVHHLLCAEEAAESRGTFGKILDLSKSRLVTHRFYDSKPACNWENHLLPSHSTTVGHWIKDSTQSANYRENTREWKNNAFQRHIVDKHHDIETCVISGWAA